MSTIITMPQKGLTEESAVVSKWYVAKGGSVKEGELLFAVEIGKATFDVEAEASGTLLDIFVDEGEEAAIKSPVCVIGEPGESYERPAGQAGRVFAAESRGLPGRPALICSAPGKGSARSCRIPRRRS